MTAKYSERFLQRGDLGSALADLRIDGRRLNATTEQGPAEVVFHDSFDTQLAKANRLLVASVGYLVLFTRKGRIAEQAASTPAFVTDLADGPVKDAIAGHVSPLRRLIALCQGRLLQHRIALLDDAGRARARCLLHVLETDGGAPVTFVDIDPLPGHGRDGQKLAQALLEIAGGQVLSIPEALERLVPGATGYVAKPRVPLTPEMSAFDAANAIIAAHLPIVRANVPGIIADRDSEFLHDYRVALRKIRSVVSLFKGTYSPGQAADLKARFAALMAPTGPLRDLDVYLIDRPDYLDMVPEPLRPGLSQLFVRFANDRRRAHRDLVKQLQSAAYAQEMQALETLFGKPGKHLRTGPEADHPAGDYARRLIVKRYRKVRKIARKITADTPDEDVHALRIQCKKLRYLMEFFAPLFGPGEIKSLIKALKKLQNNLGTFNDSVVQQEALTAQLKDLGKVPGAAAVEIAPGIGALLTVLHQRQLSERARVMETFEAFDKPKIRQRFEELFGQGKQGKGKRRK